MNEEEFKKKLHTDKITTKDIEDMVEQMYKDHTLFAKYSITPDGISVTTETVDPSNPSDGQEYKTLDYIEYKHYVTAYDLEKYFRELSNKEVDKKQTNSETEQPMDIKLEQFCMDKGWVIRSEETLIENLCDNPGCKSCTDIKKSLNNENR